MTEAFLGLGSNMGERVTYIAKAVTKISELDGTKIISESGIYETEPWGVSGQRDYLNCVIRIETHLKAEALLKAIKQIEISLGRSENVKWTEREIDIDLLFYGQDIIENDHMQVPHPQIENRKFVLHPMCEISPDFIHPGIGRSMSQILKDTKDKLRVNKYDHSCIEK